MASQIHLNEKFLSKSTLMSYCDMLENESSISTIIQIEHVKKKISKWQLMFTTWGRRKSFWIP